MTNKSDLASNKTINDEKGREYSKKIGADFKYTSIKLGKNGIDELIDSLFTKYYNSNCNYNYNILYQTFTHISFSSKGSKKGRVCRGNNYRK